MFSKLDLPTPDHKKVNFKIDLHEIAKGEDIRTTIMIKNIPNKYT